MRVLALADTAPHRPLIDLVAATTPALILLVGDLEPAWLDGIDGLDVPRLGVHGNHDRPGALEALGAQDIDLRRVEHGGLAFTGFCGAPRYTRHGVHEWTEAEAEDRIARLPPADVLVSHSPPAGVNDEPDDPVHRGSPALLAWVRRTQPAWLLHGHTHPAPPGRRVDRLGRTRVVHVRGAAMLELDAART